MPHKPGIAEGWKEIMAKCENGTLSAKMAVQKLSQIIGDKFDHLDLKEAFSRSDGMLWKLRPALIISPTNISREKVLEKRIAQAGQQDESELWGNQMPVSSGLAGPQGTGPENIDLVRMNLNRNWIQFIELKIPTPGQRPLRAAIELVKYALIYLHTRRLIEHDPIPHLPKDVMGASLSEWCVLAPASFYMSMPSGIDADHFSSEIESALTEQVQEVLANQPGIKFRFCRYSAQLDPATLDQIRAISDAELLQLTRDALDG